MHEDMRILLNAYLDGELNGIRLLEVKHHLASCHACREELEELRHVSSLLQADPAPQFMPVERFASNLNLSLTRRALPNRLPKLSSLAFWLVPVALVVLFYFVRAVFTLSGVVNLADVTGLLGNVNWLNAGQQAAWYEEVMSLFGGQAGGVQTTLSTLNSLSVWGGSLLDGFLWQAGILLLYWAWLASWWWRRGSHQVKESAVLSQV